MGIFKYILYYFIIKVIYKFIKTYKYINKCINIETVNTADIENNDIIIYNPPLKIESRKKYDIKNIYNNFFNGIKEDVKNDINPIYLKTEFKKRDIPIVLLKEIKTENNNFEWLFETKAGYNYKIKSYLKMNIENNIKNVELLISDIDGNAFIYDYILYNLNDNFESITENIYDFSFVLNNNHFGDNKINIKLNINNILVNESFIEIIERKDKENNEKSILIFDVNGRQTPLYFNKKNILDINDFELENIE